jgi:hypothetical protein
MLMQPTTAERDKWYSGFAYVPSQVSSNITEIFNYRAKKIISTNQKSPLE